MNISRFMLRFSIILMLIFNGPLFAAKKDKDKNKDNDDPPYVEMEVLVNEIDEDLTIRATDGSNYSVSEDRSLNNTDFGEFELEIFSNSSYDFYIEFSGALYNASCVPTFFASDSSEIEAQVDLLLGTLVVELFKERGKVLNNPVVLASLDGTPGKENIFLSNYGGKQNSKTDIITSVECDEKGNGIILLKVNHSKDQSSSYRVYGALLTSDGAALEENKKIVSITGEAPAGEYSLSLNFGATISDFGNSTSASDYLP